MENLTRVILGILFLGLVLLGCKSKEQAITPTLFPTFSEAYLTDKLFIKDFSFLNAKIKVPTESNPPEDYIILTLPEDFRGDFITPNINLVDNTSQISPKSGEKVFFEGERAIEYTITKRDGKTVKFNLYAVRQDKLDIEVFTKEVKLNSKDDNIIWMKVNNFGTYGSPQTNDSQSYKQVNAPIVRVFNSVSKLVYSTQFSTNGKDSTGFYIYKNDYEFLKKGNFSISFSMNEDTLFGKVRQSDTFNFKIVNGEKSFISPYSSFERAWLLNSDNIIKGVNFDSRKKYEIIFENEFLNAPIVISPKVVDENTLSVKFPNNIDTLQCWITLKEDESIIGEVDGGIVLNQQNFIKNCQFSTNYERGFEFFIKKEQPFTFNRNQAFGAYYVVSYGNNSKEAYANGALKLINIDTRSEFILKGVFIGGIWMAQASYWSFSIPDNVPKGFYEVYGINPQVNSGRYWRKLEVK